MEIWKKGEEVTASYSNRTRNREKTLMTATMNFIVYFIELGDTKENAENKVSQISSEIAPLLYVYTLGNTQPLIDAINTIDDVTYPFMDAAAKVKLKGDLIMV